MGVSGYHLRMFINVHRKYNLKGDILILGVQDVYCTHTQAANILRDNNFVYTEIPESKRKFSRSKGQCEFYPFIDKKYMHMNDLFHMLNFDNVDSMDAFDNEKPSIVHNLNNPVPVDLHEKFDVIFDIGVIEHVFDIRQAIENIVRMLKNKGVVLFYNPMIGSLNQCFYNLQPTFFFDIFKANGFDELSLYFVNKPRYWFDPDTKALWREFHYNDKIKRQKMFSDTEIFFTARKTNLLDKFITPLQGAYIKYHDKHYLSKSQLSLGNVPKIKIWLYTFIWSLPKWLRFLVESVLKIIHKWW